MDSIFIILNLVYSGSLNTPPPPVIDQNRGESISSDDLTEFIKGKYR